MNRTQKILVVCVTLLISMQFIVRPYLFRRSAIRVVHAILYSWETGDLPSAYRHWESAEASPPVYNLNSYKIKQKNFYKKDGIRRAKIAANLNFSKNNILPSGTWIFELKDTSMGWKVDQFYLER